jgi:Cu(I)/Ag(I) efflux system membrane fusion protein
VDKGNGYIEPRRVTVAARAEGFVAIASGLRAGERVATAANFLLDSESRLKGALAQLGAPETPGPVHAGHAQHGGGSRD